MFNFTYTPSKFLAATEELKRIHPFTADTIPSLYEIENSNTGKILITKLISTPEHKLNSLLAKLLPTEKRYLPYLIAHKSAHIHSKVCRCFELEPTLMKSSPIWQFLSEHFDTPLAGTITELVVKHSSALNQYKELQQHIIQGRAINETHASAEFWKRVEAQQLNPRRYAQAAVIIEKTTLYDVLGKHLLLEGTRTLLERHSNDEIASFYHNNNLFSFTDKMLVFAQLARLYDYDKKHAGLVLKHFEAPFSDLQENPKLQRILASEHPKVRQWCDWILEDLRIKQFFLAADSNHERYEFWSAYFPITKDRYLDEYGKRLFIDFGGFGVIEFLQRGNAAYVHSKENFRRFWLQRKLSYEKHTYFKRELCEPIIDPLGHYGKDWTTNFSQELEKLLNQFSETNTDTDEVAP